ncbi:MAG TPA: hypothetical protein VEA99_06555, partial [Gemmatimonadaceae bacterium]|nr:hypothetical protein [Gemmatimonadaceae bacterium]
MRPSKLPLALLALTLACAEAPVSTEVVRASDAAANAADQVTASALWNERTRTVVGRRRANANFAARAFALVSVAQYDAIIAAEEAKEGGWHPSEAGAAAGAAAAVLEGLYAIERPELQAWLASDAALFPQLPSERDADFESGVAIGRGVAAAVLARAATDGSGAPWSGHVPPGASWVPITNPPQDASWGGVRPWLMTSGDQFQPPAPPALGSPELLRDLAEVRYYSDNPSAERLAIAVFWATGYGPGGPAGYFGGVARSLAARHRLDERRMARVLAVLHMAVMDASIGCYEAKYAHWTARPYQIDAAIVVPVAKPNFPSYPSAHSCLS